MRLQSVEALAYRVSCSRWGNIKKNVMVLDWSSEYFIHADLPGYESSET